MAELKKCAHCGYPAIDADEIDDQGTFEICCSHCGSMMRGKDHGQLVADWNLRSALENKVLSMDELRKMDGEPVWVVPLTPMIDEFKPHWCIMRAEATAMSETSKGKMWFLHLCDYKKTWLAYRCKPEEDSK